MTKAVDIQTAIIKALSDEGLTPGAPSSSVQADDSANMTFSVDTAGRHCTFAVAISRAPQKELVPGWGTSYFGQDTTAQLNANMGPSGGIALKRYYWSSLESTEGVYTFGAIGQAGTIVDDLEQTRLWNLANPTRKRQMVAMIMDKSLVKGIPPCLPTYLRTEKWTDPSGKAATGYEVPIVSNMGPGTCSLRWVPRVYARMNALTTAMATAFDACDEFCGVAFMETANGIDNATMTRYGFSAARYVEMYKSILTTASNAFYQSRVFWFFNFLTGGENLLMDIAATIAALPNKNVLAGGPDLLPEDYSLVRPGFAYSMYPQMSAMGIKTFIQLSPPGYSVAHSGAPGKYWSFQELHDYAVNTLKCSHILAVPNNGGHIKYVDLVKQIPTLPII